MRLKLNKRKKYETKIQQEKEEKMMIMMKKTYKNNLSKPNI